MSSSQNQIDYIDDCIKSYSLLQKVDKEPSQENIQEFIEFQKLMFAKYEESLFFTRGKEMNLKDFWRDFGWLTNTYARVQVKMHFENETEYSLQFLD